MDIQIADLNVLPESTEVDTKRVAIAINPFARLAESGLYQCSHFCPFFANRHVAEKNLFQTARAIRRPAANLRESPTELTQINDAKCALELT